MTPDAINACFELGGAALIWLNVKRLCRDRSVRGVFAPVFVFYTAWGFWNCIFYPAIGQMISFYAGAGTTLGNLTWCALAWRFREPPTTQKVKAALGLTLCKRTGHAHEVCACPECFVDDRNCCPNCGGDWFECRSAECRGER